MKVFFFFLFIVGLIELQIFLSKRENKWVGLVLPVIAFLLSPLCPLNMVVPSGGMTEGFVVQIIMVWLIGIIPAIVFLAIYFSCRGKRFHSRQLDKMNIQDLN